MTSEEIGASGPALSVGAIPPSWMRGGYRLTVTHPAGSLMVNHAANPLTLSQARKLAARLFPGVKWEGVIE